MRFVRTLVLHLFLAQRITGLPGTYFNEDFLKDIDAFAETAKVPVSMTRRLHAMRQNISKNSVGLANLRDMPMYELSAANCFHLGDHPSVRVSEDEARLLHNELPHHGSLNIIA